MHSNEALFTVLALYFLPPIIAGLRGHNSTAAIFVLTLTLGWTLLGWLVALIWSFTGNVRSPAVSVQQNVVVAAAPAPTVAVNVALTAPAPAPQVATLRKQMAALQAQAEGWRAELDDIGRRRPPDGAHRAEIVGRVAQNARQVLREIRDEVSDGVPARGPEPNADGPATPLEAQTSREGRPYYRNAAPPRLSDYPYLRGPSLFEIAVVGCGHHQVELDVIAGGRRDAPVYFHTNALVYPEPSNAYDPNAVAVDIGGWRVGYIAREDAPAFGAELSAIGSPGAFACRALIENGWPEWRVKLDAFRPLERG